MYGQDRVRDILQSAFENGKLAHAYLFLGPEGTGKTAAALGLALMIQCESHVFGGCGECGPCARLLNHESPDVMFVQPEPNRPKSMKQDVYRDIIRERILNKLSHPYNPVRFTPELTTQPLITVDQIRAMKKKAFLKVAGSGMRIYIVSQADTMNVSAANSLLKLLEEPPDRTIIILTSDRQEGLLETVVSRCQVVKFAPMTDREVEDALAAEKEIAPDHAALLAAMAEGSIARVLDLADSDFTAKREQSIAYVRHSLLGRFDKVAESEHGAALVKDRALAREVLEFLVVWFRDMLLVKMNLADRVANKDRISVLRDMVESFPGVDPDRAMHEVYQAIDYIGKNVYLPLVVYSLSCKLYVLVKHEG